MEVETSAWNSVGAPVRIASCQSPNCGRRLATKSFSAACASAAVTGRLKPSQVPKWSPKRARTSSITAVR